MAKEISERSQGHNEVADVYDSKKKSWYINRFRAIPKRIYELTGKESPSVLDLGCGTGLILSWFNGRRVGVDCSEKMLEVAERERPGPTYVFSDISNFRTEERFDAIILVDVIEFLKDLSFFRQLRNLLNQDGVLLVVNINPKMKPLVWLFDKLNMKLPTGKWIWRKPEDIMSAVKEAGFNKVFSEPNFPHIYYWGFG